MRSHSPAWMARLLRSRRRSHGRAGTDEATGHGRRLRAGLLSALGLTILAGALVAAVPGLGGVLAGVRHATPGWFAIAVALELASCAGYVAAFQLVFPAIERRFAARVAWAEMAFSAVVPFGGASGVAVGGWLLHDRGLSLRHIARRSAVLFLLTSAINVVALLVFGLVVAVGLLPSPHPVLLGAGPAALAALLLAAFFALARWTRGAEGEPSGRLAIAARAVGQSTRDTVALLRRPNWRLAGALAYLSCDVAVLAAAFAAVGHPIGAGPLVLAYLIGYLSNFIPVPGGVGALEGGMVGALVLYGVPVAPAAGAVLLYHALALWLPTTIGALAFARARREVRARPERPSCQTRPLVGDLRMVDA